MQNYYNRIAIARPDIILPLQLSGYEYEPLSGTVYQPMYKKGGVLKAQNGLPSYRTRLLAGKAQQNLGVKLNDYDYSNVYDPDAGLTGFDQSRVNDDFTQGLITNIENSDIPNAYKRAYIQDLQKQLSQSSNQPKFGDYGIDTSQALSDL